MTSGLLYPQLNTLTCFVFSSMHNSFNSVTVVGFLFFIPRWFHPCHKNSPLQRTCSHCHPSARFCFCVDSSSVWGAPIKGFFLTVTGITDTSIVYIHVPTIVDVFKYDVVCVCVCMCLLEEMGGRGWRLLSRTSSSLLCSEITAKTNTSFPKYL